MADVPKEPNPKKARLPRQQPQASASTGKAASTTITATTTTAPGKKPVGSTLGLEPPPQHPVPHADIPPEKQVIKEKTPLTNSWNEDPTKITGTLRSKAKPGSEYISSHPRDISQGMVRALPKYIDLATQHFGVDLYEQMMLDPQVSSAVDILRMSALYNKFRLSVHHNVPSEDQEAAQTIVDFCQYNLDNLATPFEQVLYALSQGVYLGSKVAEMVYRVDVVDEQVGPQLFLDDIRPKPANATLFVVDDKNNLLGLLSTVNRLYAEGTFLPLDSDGQIEGLIPRSKFVIYINDPHDNDPRGTSVLRAVYTEWWMKVQLKPEYLQFLATMAVPSIKGELPENAQRIQELDALGNPTGNFIDPAVQMQQALDAVRNGGTIVYPNTASVDLLQNGAINDGNVFVSAFDMFDRHITKGVTKQTLATEQGVHMARAASVTHQDVLAMPVARITTNMSNTIRNDILKPLVLYNFGEDAARRLVPEVQSGQVDQQDFGVAAAGFAQLQTAGLIEPEQRQHVWEALGMPPVDQDVLAARAAEEAARQQAMMEALGEQPVMGSSTAPKGDGKQGNPATALKDTRPSNDSQSNPALSSRTLEGKGQPAKRPPKIQTTRANRQKP